MPSGEHRSCSRQTGPQWANRRGSNSHGGPEPPRRSSPPAVTHPWRCLLSPLMWRCKGPRRRGAMQCSLRATHVDGGGLGLPGSLLQVGTVNDHGYLATQGRNRITTSLACNSSFSIGHEPVNHCSPVFAGSSSILWAASAASHWPGTACICGSQPSSGAISGERWRWTPLRTGHLARSHPNALKQKSSTEALTGYRQISTLAANGSVPRSVGRPPPSRFPPPEVIVTDSHLRPHSETCPWRFQRRHVRG